MTDDTKPENAAARTVSIPLTPSVNALITANGEWWRTQALLGAVEVDGLKAELSRSRDELKKAGEALEALVSPESGAD